MMTGRNQTGETPPLPGNERPHWKPTRKILTKDEMTRENRKTVKEKKKKTQADHGSPPPPFAPAVLYHALPCRGVVRVVLLCVCAFAVPRPSIKNPELRVALLSLPGPDPFHHSRRL